MPISEDQLVEGGPAKPRQIAFCVTDLNPGGAEKALFQLVTGLNRSRWSPRVYCLGPEAELAGALREKNLPVECYGARGWKSMGVISWLTGRLREQHPCLLQCFLFHANLVGRIAGRRAGVPVIVSGHRVAEREKHWHLWLDRWTRVLVDHHVCVSRGVAEHVATLLRVPPSRISVIPNGVDPLLGNAAPANLVQEFGIPIGSPVVLAVGRLHPQKGFLTLLEAFERATRKFPAAHLLIAGEGPQRKQLQDRIAQLGLAGRVHLSGYRRDVPALMRAADVLVVTSLWEGMPNVVLEAMAVGLPVVSSAVEGIEELIEHEKQGLVVTSQDAEGFAQAMERLLMDSPLRRRLAEAAQHVVHNKFAWEEVILKYEQLYRNLLS